MRRLPVFFVLDVSESMAGDNLRKMEDGLSSIVRSLRQDPHALETVYISVIGFAGVARTLAPLVEIVTFYPPKLPIGSGTSLGAALEELMVQIDTSVAKTTPDKKGDWKPIVYLFTDGKPTDDVDWGIKRWQRDYAKKAHLVAVALGRYADISVLRQLTEHVLVFEESNEGDFAKFIQWVTASVTAHSRSVGEGGADTVSLAKPDSSVLSLAKDTPVANSTGADSDSVVMVGRCQKSRKPYLMKYDRVGADLDFKLGVDQFEVTGCYPIEESYFDWSDHRASDLKVSTSQLIGTPGCPHCGNQTAFAMCGCGGLMCLNGPGRAACPWCEKECEFGSGGDDSSFDVRRGRG
jgi:uncharacterized protein YegL